MSFNFPSFADIGERIVGHNVILHRTDDENGGEYIMVGGGYAEHAHIDKDGKKHVRFRIDFQNGPCDRSQGPGAANGAFVEDIIEVLRIRLECYQESSFAHEANATAIAHLKSAFKALVERRQDRRDRGVEGQNKP